MFPKKVAAMPSKKRAAEVSVATPKTNRNFSDYFLEASDGSCRDRLTKSGLRGPAVKASSP